MIRVVSFSRHSQSGLEDKVFEWLSVKDVLEWIYACWDSFDLCFFDRHQARHLSMRWLELHLSGSSYSCESTWGTTLSRAKIKTNPEKILSLVGPNFGRPDKKFLGFSRIILACSGLKFFWFSFICREDWDLWFSLEIVLSISNVLKDGSPSHG